MTSLRGQARGFGRTRELEEQFVAAVLRNRDAGRTSYVAVPPGDAHLAMTLRLRRLGITVVESADMKPGVAMLLDGVPCTDCGMPVDDPRLKFCNDCRHRFAAGGTR